MPSSSLVAKAWTMPSGIAWVSGERGWLGPVFGLGLWACSLGAALTLAICPGASCRPWCSAGRRRSGSASCTSSPGASITATLGSSPQWVGRQGTLGAGRLACSGPPWMKAGRVFGGLQRSRSIWGPPSPVRAEETCRIRFSVFSLSTSLGGRLRTHPDLCYHAPEHGPAWTGEQLGGCLWDRGWPGSRLGMALWMGEWLVGVPTCLECQLSPLSTATEHREEHELPGIHKQPERPTGGWEFPQGAAEGEAQGCPGTGSLLSSGLALPRCPQRAGPLW